MRELFTTGIAVHKFFLCFVRTWSMGSRATMYGSQKSHNPDWNVMKMKRKLTMTTFSEMIIEIKTTQPISMILVSFFSEDNVLSDEIKIYNIFKF